MGENKRSHFYVKITKNNVCFMKWVVTRIVYSWRPTLLIFWRTCSSLDCENWNSSTI